VFIVPDPLIREAQRLRLFHRQEDPDNENYRADFSAFNKGYNLEFPFWLSGSNSPCKPNSFPRQGFGFREPQKSR